MMITRFVDAIERYPIDSRRRIFIYYAVALTIGTHWPKLTIQAPVGIGIDKVLHVLAFCGLTILLMVTRWPAGLFGRGSVATRIFGGLNVGAAVIIGLVWATLDELSQMLPILHRHVTWPDYMCDIGGVLTAGVFAWAILGRAKTRTTGPPQTE